MTDLITLAEVKRYATISSTNSDSQIQFIIPKASQLVKNYCGRTFIDYYSEEKVEVFSGGIPSLFLVECPTNEITSVEYSSDYGKTYTRLTEYVDFALNKETDTVDVINQKMFPKLLNGYRVTYTGGFESTPEDIKIAMCDLVNYYLKSDMSVKSTRSPGSSATQVEYIVNATLPSHIRRVLDAYRLIL